MSKENRVLLEKDQFHSELTRIWDLANQLKGDERIAVKLVPRLDYGQCWGLVKALRRAGVDARADCDWDGVRSIFKEDSEDCVTIQIRQFPTRESREVDQQIQEWPDKDREVPYRTQRGKKKRPSGQTSEQLSPERLEQLLRQANAQLVPFSEMRAPVPLERKFLRR